MQPPKKILILVENLPVPFDRRVWMEATTLTEAGYSVSVICPMGKNYDQPHEIIDNVSIYRYPLISTDGVFGHLLEYAIALPATFFLTLMVYFREGFDVIQSANPPDYFFMIGRIFKLFGKKYVFDHHDLMPEICASRWSGWKYSITNTLSSWAEKNTFKTADWVISTNESYKEIAITRGNIPPERVTVVRSGPKRNQFTKVEPIEELKRGKKYLVCYLGVMGPNDGLDYLLKAIAHIVYQLRRGDIHFTLIGDGDLHSDMRQMSSDLDLEGFVEFTGRISDFEVRRILSTADVGVAPDPKDPLNDVSTMNKIIEYMALEKPIVSFDLKESRISAGDAAVYARPNDIVDFARKIVDLLDNPQQRAQMASYGRNRFEKHLAWEHQQERLRLVYDRLLS